MKHFLLALLASLPAFAQNVAIPGYRPHRISDLSRLGVTKEQVFRQLDRSFVKINSSICSNRAHMWAWDMLRDYGAETAKIFLFYTDQAGTVGNANWWHHVANVVNERGRLYVVDGGFPGMINGPLAPAEWMEKFAGSRRCRQIRAGEEDLIELMFRGRAFPRQTRYGNADCYYRLTPAGYWTPNTVAENLLGRDASGRPVRLVRDEIDRDELIAACTEATTTRAGRLFTNERERCESYVNWRGRRQ